MKQIKAMLTLVLILVAAICGESNKNHSPVTESIATDGAILVNGTWITHADIENVITICRKNIMNNSPEKALNYPTPEDRKNIAMQLLVNVLLVQEAQKLNFAAEDVKVDSIFEDIKNNYPDTLAMQKDFAKIGQTQESVLKQIREGIIVDNLIKKTFAENEPANNPAQSSMKRDGRIRNYIDSLRTISKIMYKDTFYMPIVSKVPVDDPY
jgi:hypothetical protein